MSNNLTIPKQIFALLISFIFIFSTEAKAHATEQYSIEANTYEIIEEAADINPAIKYYVDNILSMYSEEHIISNDELNDIIVASVKDAVEISKQTQKELNIELKKHEQFVISEKQKDIQFQEDSYSPNSVIIPDPFLLARTNWALGIAAVETYGHQQTAKYMRHATVPVGASNSWAPGPYISHNDAWARRVALDDGLNAELFPIFEDNVYNKGLSNFRITGSFRYAYGETNTSLNNVNYAVTFTKLSSGAFRTSYFISDTFDFEWNKYDNIVVDFANNYAFGMQELGLIKPYEISISYVN